MAKESLSSQIKQILETFQKAESKTYLMQFLYDEDYDTQRQLIRMTFEMYYHDETNPFQSLMPKLTRYSVEGPYPEALKDEVKYRVMRDIQDKKLLEAKRNGEDIAKVFTQKEFANSVDSEVDKKMCELFKDEKNRYYVLVQTDDLEYQAQLDKMMEPGSEINVKGLKLGIVIARFDKRA